MSKELPYFRFYSSEWLEGNITLENERTQGLFIQICAWYWKKDCEIDLQFLNKRLINGKAMLKQCLNRLLESNIVKVDENEMVTIEFLDDQYLLLEGKRNKLVEAGRIGGKASFKHRLSYKDKDKDKDKEKDKNNDKKKSKFDLIFEEFIKMRIKIRKPLTEKAKELILNKLCKLTDSESDKILILEQSIENSWQGVFELKNKKVIDGAERYKAELKAEIERKKNENS